MRGILLLVVLVAGCAGPAVSTAPSVAPTLPLASIATPEGTPTPAPTAVAAGPWLVYQGASGLELAQVDGSASRPLFAARQEPPDPAHADWSPDGTRLTFQAGVDGSWDIWIANADGSDAAVLVDCSAPCVNMDGPAWSPDGASIAFSQLDETGPGVLPSRLQVVEVATGAIQTLAAPENGVELASPRWAPDGTRIVVEVRQHRMTAEGPQAELDGSAIAVVDVASEAPTLTTITEMSAFGNYPDWHPSGDGILFTGGEAVWDTITSSTANLFTIRPDGTELQQLTAFGADDPVVWLPAWTPDGAAILATTTDRTTRALAIARLAPDGSSLEALPIVGAHARLQPTPMAGG